MHDSLQVSHLYVLGQCVAIIDNLMLNIYSLAGLNLIGKLDFLSTILRILI